MNTHDDGSGGIASAVPDVLDRAGVWGAHDPHHLRMRTNGRPTAQWARLEAGRSDDLTGET